LIPFYEAESIGMRTVLLAILAILLGVALGFGVAELRIKASPWNPDATVRQELEH
jgi:hypothetical protein